jgi:hypothetical protein
MIKEQLPEVSIVTKENAEEFREIDDTVVIAYLRSEDEHLTDVFREIAAEKHNEIVFGLATDASLARQLNLSVPSVVCFKRRDGDHLQLSGQFDKETLQTFIKVGAPLTIGEITKRTIQDYVGVGVILTSCPFLVRAHIHCRMLNRSHTSSLAMTRKPSHCDTNSHQSQRNTANTFALASSTPSNTSTWPRTLT